MSADFKLEVLKRLQRADGQPLSGQQLADTLAISRTAIWKHMNQLKEEGYVIETIRKKGYILKEVPDIIDVAKIKAALETTSFGQVIHYEEQLASTQPVAHQLAQQGAQEGTIVICEQQTAGKGRMLRPWVSEKGKGIWMSVILRPDVPTYKAPQFTLVAAVAVAKAIEDVVDVRPEIKWPNDLLINGYKCTGILTEMQAEPDRINALIMGIGINVNHAAEDFPEELRPIATSLKMITNKEIDRATLIARILFYLEQYSAAYVADGFTHIKKEWENYSCTLGNRIRVTTLREQFVGQAIEISEEGILSVRLDDGEVKRVYSADITLES